MELEKVIVRAMGREGMLESKEEGSVLAPVPLIVPLSRAEGQWLMLEQEE